MTDMVLSNMTASITELKKNPMETIASAEGAPIAILNRNKTEFYCVPASIYEDMLERLDDLKLADIITKRTGQKEIEVDFDDL
ncbi:plasmid stabilization protein [Rickettsiales bacterium]|nr:plasmid stabilization protein [Rickettsiales bacterium]